MTPAELERDPADRRRRQSVVPPLGTPAAPHSTMALPSGFLEASLPIIAGGPGELGPADPVFLRCVTGPATNPVDTMLRAESWPGWRLYGGPLRFDQFPAVRNALRDWAFAAGYSIHVAAVPLVPFDLWKPPHVDFRWHPWTYESSRPARWRIAQAHPLQWQKVA